MRRFASGSWELNVRHENIDRLINELDRSSNRLSFAVVIASIIVGSSVVVSADSTLTFFNLEIRYFGMFGYMVAGVLGLALSWAIFGAAGFTDRLGAVGFFRSG
jgi:ubiquinone biosynthesis protein